MKKQLSLGAIALFLFVAWALASATGWAGKVVRVLDGDTIEVLHSGKAERIRLYGVDAPEKAQAFGRKAKDFTADLVAGKIVEVLVKDRDRYGRTVAVVSLPGGEVLNRELVRAGFAWWYRQYAQRDTALARLEAEARAGRRGLWADKDPLPPWEFRHKSK